jgi:truncated hemoglobin YjbI
MNLGKRLVWTLSAAVGIAALTAASGCGNSNTTSGAGGTGGTSTGSGASSSALYDKLGKNEGITKVVNGFVGRVLVDSRINGYFLNQKVDGAALTACLVKQLGSATGGPEKYDCKDMKTVHKGLGISKQDFDDLAGDLVDELKANKVEQADIDTIVGVLAPMAADIVEDPDNNKTIYQRVGRKPGIQTVITNFAGKVLADATLKDFFTGTDVGRLGTCLVRQVCAATGGPCAYGSEVDTTGLKDANMKDVEPGVSKMAVCRDMKTTHEKINMSAKPITIDDFNKLVGYVVDALKEAKVADADIMAIGGALGPTCKDIVKDGTGCPM